jgi:hypothetical protein
VAGLAAGYERAVLDFPGLFVHFRWFPTVEGLAIAKRNKAGLDFGGYQSSGGEENGYRSQSKEGIVFHAADDRPAGSVGKSKGNCHGVAGT